MVGFGWISAFTNSLANWVKIDGGIIPLDSSRHRLIIVTMHYSNEDFCLSGSLICKVRPETQTVSSNYSTSEKKIIGK